MATWYGPGFYGGPLACDRGNGLHHAPGRSPWAAIDRRAVPDWLCNDRLRIVFEAGPVLTVTLLDTGPFMAYYIEDFGPERPIVVDVAEYAWPFDLAILSAPARVLNLSYQERINERGME